MGVLVWIDSAVAALYGPKVLSEASGWTRSPGRQKSTRQGVDCQNPQGFHYLSAATSIQSSRRAEAACSPRSRTTILLGLPLSALLAQRERHLEAQCRLYSQAKLQPLPYILGERRLAGTMIEEVA